LGEARHYHPGASRIPNLYSISTPDPREHFLLPCLLGRLGAEADIAASEGYVVIDDLVQTFQTTGFSLEQMDFALARALDGDLVETLPPDPPPRSARLTAVGAFARGRLAADFTYLDVIIVDTPIVGSGGTRRSQGCLCDQTAPRAGRTLPRVPGSSMG